MSSHKIKARKNLLLLKNFNDQLELEPSQLQLLESFYEEITKEESVWVRTWRRLTTKNGKGGVARSYLKR